MDQPHRCRWLTALLLPLLLTACLGGGGSDNGATPPPPPEPSPPTSAATYLEAVGIGVSDLDAALDFYRNGLGMRVVARRTRENREETVMESADATGSNLVLMAFTDGVPRNLRQNPGKLVFYTRDMESYVASFLAAGGRITLPPTRDPALGVTVGFGRDLHNNLIELVADPAAEHSYFGAFGIGVSDLEAARAFYVDELGFRQLLYLPIPGMYNEYILQGYGGSALVLMNWTNGAPHNYQDNPVKMEIRSIAPAAFAEAVERAGGELLQVPEVTDDPGLEGEIIGIAKDLDGSLMEIQQARWGMDIKKPRSDRGFYWRRTQKLSARSPCSSLIRVGSPISLSRLMKGLQSSSSTLTIFCTSHLPWAIRMAAATGGTPAV